ncbi:MAG: lytic murein transglycosylase B [Rhodocyclaceae bacterium]|nr:lytic murein transglycosylase B [Rhodocyclaceae bacterium]
MKRLAFALVLAAAGPAWASYADRPEVQAFIEEMQRRHQLDASALTELFSRTSALPSVLRAIAPPADPRQRSWAAYRTRFIEPKRLAAGVRFMREHRAALAKAEAMSGVPAEIIAAIIGIETFYGKHLGRYETFAALATLAFDYPPRAELFRRELEALLLLARDEGKPPTAYRGSYAGAIGLPQFLPSSIRAYATDFDRDGRVDLVASIEDAIGSVANFLKEHGWQAGGPLAFKVGAGGTAPAELLAAGIMPHARPSEMRALGLAVPPEAPEAPAALIDLATPEADTEYWLGYQNFYVITRYNRSSFYAMAVCQFAEALQAALKAAPAPRRPGD